MINIELAILKHGLRGQSRPENFKIVNRLFLKKLSLVDLGWQINYCTYLSLRKLLNTSTTKLATAYVMRMTKNEFKYSLQVTVQNSFHITFGKTR